MISRLKRWTGIALTLAGLLTAPTAAAQTTLEHHRGEQNLTRITNEHYGTLTNVSFLELYDDGGYFAKTTTEYGNAIRAIAQTVHIGKDDEGNNIQDRYGIGAGVAGGKRVSAGLYILPLWFDATGRQQRVTVRGKLYANLGAGFEAFWFAEPRLDSAAGYGELQVWKYFSLGDTELGLTYNPTFTMQKNTVEVAHKAGVVVRF